MTDANKTFFDTIKRDFKDVTITPTSEIDTAEFLEAAESLVTLFDLLGNSAFSVVQTDMRGNIKKIRDRLLSSPATSTTLQSLVSSELASKSHVATEGLQWLTRGLNFTSKAIRQNVGPANAVSIAAGEELSTSFRAAYETTLGKHHSWVVKKIFSVAMAACPKRERFYENLGGDRERVQSQLAEWLSALERVVAILDPWIDNIKW